MKDDMKSLPRYPRLRRDADVGFVADGSVLVRGYGGSISLTGEFVSEALPELLPKLDGQRQIDALFGEVSPDFRPEFEEFLRIVEARGFLCDGPEPDGPSDGRNAYWQQNALDGGTAHARLAAARVLVAGSGVVGSALKHALIAGGVGHCTQLSRAALCTSLQAPGTAHNGSIDPGDNTASVIRDATLIVLASDAMSLAGVDEVNTITQDTRVPWLLVRVDRSSALIGPYVVPGETACFTCYELRARANAERPQEHEALFHAWRRAPAASADFATPPEYGMILGNWIALDLMRTIVNGRNSAATGRIIALDLHSLATTFREILRLPRCPVCSRQRKMPLARIWDIPRTAARTSAGQNA